MRLQVLLAILTAALAFPVQAAPNDPLLRSKGAWGQDHEDQWALVRIGLGAGSPAWKRIEQGARQPVIVAVIDTGIDWTHPDIDRARLWRNPREKPNGRDDDGNGYVDDLIGWNFVDGDNQPFDHSGHGTFTAGIIAAATDNGEGVAGINPQARIMPLKVMNFLGRGRALGVAEAIFYAVANGARVVNLSLGGEEPSRTARIAADYARSRGVLVVVAAGNVSQDTRQTALAGVASAITVASSGLDDARAGFSNWGAAVKLAAPGVDVLSLRARRTDFVLLSAAKDYRAGEAFVGPRARYYRASGTSFSAPLVAGAASLLWSLRPELSADQVERMLLMSARDIGETGWDQYSGAGLLDVAAALDADPDWFLIAQVGAVAPASEKGQPVVAVDGRAVGSGFASYRIELGQGAKPSAWKEVFRSERAVEGGRLGSFPVQAITARGTWSVRLVVRDREGKERVARGSLDVQ